MDNRFFFILLNVKADYLLKFIILEVMMKKFLFLVVSAFQISVVKRKDDLAKESKDSS